MKDFNIAKYLKENYQGPFSRLQSYVEPINEAESIDLNAKKIIDALMSGGNAMAKKEIAELVSVLKNAKVIKTQNGFKVESPDKLSNFFYATLAARLNDYSDVVKHLKNNEFEIISDKFVLQEIYKSTQMKDFNITKYLRENYQGPFSMFQPYTDLNPLKEESEEQLDTEIPYKGPDPHLDGMGSDYEQEAPVEEGNSYPESEEDVIRRLKKDIGKKVYFDWVDMVDDKTNETILDGALAADNEGNYKYTYDQILAAAKKFYKITESETSPVEEAMGAEQDEFDRTMDLFGQQVVDIANEMIDDGYEKEDAVQFLRDMANYIETNVI